MQALALWEIGLKRWNERRAGQGTPEKRPGVASNRRDLLAVPVPNAALLWRQLHTRDMRKVEGRQRMDNVPSGSGRRSLISRAWPSLTAWTAERRMSATSNVCRGKDGRSKTTCVPGKRLRRMHAPETEPMLLFAKSAIDTRVKAMAESVTEIEQAFMKLDKGSPWDADVKVSDDFLRPLFSTYFKKLHLPNLMEKKSFYVLAAYVPEHERDPEIGEKLDEIARVANAGEERHRERER